MRPPASCKIEIPAATSLKECQHGDLGAVTRNLHHSQQPPSHQMSKEPIAQYARSIVALQHVNDLKAWHKLDNRGSTYLPRLLTPCTIPPLPPRPPTSAAMLRKLSIFRWRLPSGISLRSLPHSQEKTHLPGAFGGIGGIGLRIKGSCCASFNHAPRPEQALNSWLRNGAYITPIVALPFRMKPMETQNIGNRCVKFTVPSKGSTHQVGSSLIRYSRDEPFEYVSSPRNLLTVSYRPCLTGRDELVVRVFLADFRMYEMLDICKALDQLNMQLRERRH